MKRKLSCLLLIPTLGTALLLQPGTSAQSTSSGLPDTAQREDRTQDLPERETITRSHQLEAGAQVDVSNIRGPVQVDTVAGDTAHIEVVRSARKREELSQSNFIIERTPTGLVIRNQRQMQKADGKTSGKRIRERVKLTLPRNVNLKLSGINGDLRVGELEGQVQVNGINGVVNIMSADTILEIRSVIGNVSASVKRVDSRGMSVKAIVGSVELGFSEGVNADLKVHTATGGVISKIPRLVSEGIYNPANLRGRIGEGGPLVAVSEVVGSVTLESR